MKDLYGVEITEKSIAVRNEYDAQWYPSHLGYNAKYYGNNLMSFSPTWGSRKVEHQNNWIKVCLPISDSDIPENMKRVDEYHLADENGTGHIKTQKGIESISVCYGDYRKEKSAE